MTWRRVSEVSSASRGIRERHLSLAQVVPVMAAVVCTKNKHDAPCGNLSLLYFRASAGLYGIRPGICVLPDVCQATALQRGL